MRICGIIDIVKLGKERQMKRLLAGIAAMLIGLGVLIGGQALAAWLRSAARTMQP
jgi:hypothetical protein